ncbi:MAG: tetratricopeptide repeat protein [Kofleriaceae bacterium]|jgi:tetratricopeptide (TPR) repeat protein|nr:tetratricopeptide repeat protein [Kofleriaceae bacterium]MBP6842045.1 tetratricopeptide repeat protein [Kofleriaceae bacterium]MBP9203230.1 tetratricopeptide repeat protein [Kofleriaceae bacterium]
MKLTKIATVLSLAVALAACPNKEKNASIEHMNAGVKALNSKQFESAKNAFEKAVASYRDNHSAHYYLGYANAQRENWTAAVEGFEKAAQIKPEEPMYQLYLGVALYEKALQVAREAAAKAQGKKPQEVEIDVSNLNYESALQHLDAATKKNQELWRAHYFAGRIHRNKENAQQAAESFTKAIQANPFEAAPYIALAELYRQWDYPDQAIQVATIGTQQIPGAAEASNVWFVLGMGHNDKRQDDKAVEAFAKAIESRKDNHKAKFQRGQALFRKGDYDKAKPDLEQFAKSGGQSADFEKAQANKMLMDIAAKQR